MTIIAIIITIIVTKYFELNLKFLKFKTIITINFIIMQFIVVFVIVMVMVMVITIIFNLAIIEFIQEFVVIIKILINLQLDGLILENFA